MFNASSEKSIGLQLTEYIGTKNNHLLSAVNKLTANTEIETKNEENEGSLADKKPEVPKESSSSLLGTYLICNMGRDAK